MVKLWDGKRPFRYALLVLAAMALSLESVSMVFAFDNTFPDPADTEGNSTIWAYNGETRYVRETNSALRVWFPGTSGTVNITNANFCASNSPDYVETEDGSFSSYGNGTNVTRFHFFNASVDASRYGEKFASGDGRCNDTKSISFSGLTQQENGYYFVNINVDYVANANTGYDGGMNGYKLSASSGARIGVRSNNSGRGTTQEQTGGALNYINYFASFGTPCDQTSAQTATLQLYDIDNVGGSGAQPSGGPEVRVRIYNITNDVYVDFDGGVGTTWRPNGDNTISQINFTARPGRKYRLELLDVYKNNTIQYGVPFPQIFRLACGWEADGQARVDGVMGTINARRSTAHTFNFRVYRTSGSGEPDIRVVERWQSGNTGNVFDQKVDLNFNDDKGFTVPANATPGTNYCMDVWFTPSANDEGAENSNNACIHVVEANMSALLTLTPDDTPTNYVEPGETVTAQAAIRNNGTSEGNIQFLHQMWFETGARDNTYDADDLSLQTRGWENRTVAAGATPVVNTFTQSTSNPPATAAYACSRLQIQRQAGDTSIISVSDVAKCVPIGKSPSIAVPNGSVRTGGNYGSGTCRVSLPAIASPTNDKYNHYFGVIAHKYDRDAANPHHTYVADSVLAVGDIDNTVSMKAGIGTGADTRLHFARGPGPDMAADAVNGGGHFYGAFTDIDGADGAVNNVFGENPFKTHCLTSLFDATRYPAATDTPNVSAVTSYALPDPVTGAKAVTLQMCGDVPNRLLTLTRPTGSLNLSAGQQYIVRVVTNPANAACDDNPVYVKLSTNVRYTGTAATIDKLPQFVFLAGDNSGSRVSIHIDNSVVRLDGIYANRGANGAATFLTCAQRAGTPLSTLVAMDSNQCGNRLKINGAVVLGGRLDPYRAFGHGQAGNTEPAETFNLRADTTLSDYARDHSSSQLEVVNQRELAPRF